MDKTDIKINDVFKPDDDIIKRKIGDDLCLYSPVKSVIMSLNQTAAFIFKKCNGKKDLKDILDELSKIHKKERTERLREDLFKLISEMTEKGFLVKV